jgi:hypothetical protein
MSMAEGSPAYGGLACEVHIYSKRLYFNFNEYKGLVPLFYAILIVELNRPVDISKKRL